MSNLLNRKSLCALLICGSQFIPQLAFSQDAAAGSVRMLQLTMGAQPRNKGELSCFEIGVNPVKKVCHYIPVNQTLPELQRSVLRYFYGGRQPANPDEAFVNTLNNGQLEFSDVNTAVVDQIIKVLPTVDILDVRVERRKVEIIVQILQLSEGSDSSGGFLLGGQYNRQGRKSVTDQDNVTTKTAGGLINFNFSLGNFVNTLLDLTLNNFKSRNDVKVISSVPITLTHGYQLGSVNPYSKRVYLQTNSVSTVTEQEGINFEGQARFYDNTDSKIGIKDFMMSVSQFEPNGVKNEGSVDGALTIKSPPRDIELEIGCSTAIRIINVNRKSVRTEKNLVFSSKKEEADSKKDFVFIVQAVSDSKGTPPSNNCSQTGITIPAALSAKQ